MDEYTPEGIEPVPDDKADCEWEWRSDTTTVRVTKSGTVGADFRRTLLFIWWQGAGEAPEPQWISADPHSADAFITGLGTALSGLGFRQVA